MTGIALDVLKKTIYHTFYKKTHMILIHGNAMNHVHKIIKLLLSLKTHLNLFVLDVQPEQKNIQFKDPLMYFGNAYQILLVQKIKNFK